MFGLGGGDWFGEINSNSVSSANTGEPTNIAASKPANAKLDL